MRSLPRRSFVKAVGIGSAAMASGWHIASGARNQDKIHIGQIGTGHAHAAGKMETMLRLDDRFEVVGVVEADDRQRQAVQRHRAYRNVKWVSEEDLLNTSGLQAVAVETTVKDLVKTAARCVEAGMHVHLDKPAGDSLEDFRQLLEAATRRKRVVQMGYMFRYNPAFKFLFKTLSNGLAGDVFALHAVMSKTVNAESRRRLAEFPGGSMFELGCHLIDAMVTALGEPHQVHPFIRRTNREQDSLADNCLAVFEYPQATATVRSSLIEVDGFRRRQFVVCGDGGTIVIRPLEPPRLSITLSAPAGDLAKGTHEVTLPKPGGRYDGDFDDLARILREEKDADYSPEHDLAVQKAVLQASGMDA